VNVFPTQIEEQILRDKRLSGNYQILISREAHLDQLEVRCELQREISDRVSADEVEAIGKELQHHIKTNIGISTRITVLPLDSIPRTLAGKARRLIDERPRQL
jgi:phenylacetate-CoA ligase